MDDLEVALGPVPKSKGDGVNDDNGTAPPPKKPGSKAQGRKRTKSGCLTCRKRRIKCGEERPTCQNCTKSKRQCEGYNQRVVFKDPLSAYRPSLPASHVSFSSRSGLQPIYGGEMFQQAPSNANPLPIAPKPTGSQSTMKAPDISRPLGRPHDPSPGIEHQIYVFPGGPTPSTTEEQRRTSQPNSSQSFVKDTDTVDHSQLPDPKRRSPRDQPPHYDFNALTKQEGQGTGVPGQLSPLDWSASRSSGSQLFPQELFYDSNRQFPAAARFHQSYPANSSWDSLPPFSAISGPSLQAQTDAKLPILGPENVDKPQWAFDGVSQISQNGQQEPLRIVPPVTPLKIGKPLSADQFDLMEEDDDDPFDVLDDVVDMEEQMEEQSAVRMWHGEPEDEHLRNNDLGIVVALQAGQDNQGLRMRSFTDFIDRPDMLATYAPSIQSSPLRDPMTARIFCHFINVTAPSISMYERHPANPSLIFQGQPVPKSQQHIWTYTFPTLALQNTALLHAMLSIACLHISQLQNSPVTQSLKHYHISLRRIGKALSMPSKRAQPATVAAAMLLAFYECWCADHQKWSNHLLGAKHLLNQVDFAGISKYIKKSKQIQRETERARYYQAQQQNGGHGFLEDRTRFQSYVDDVDENIVGMLMGKKLRYGEYGQVLEDIEDDGGNKVYTEKDLEVYETQRDLFWWYAKQDVYQSILGGGKLFLNYDLWSRCPPRAPLGRLNATYGTYDHLMLLMARVADFAAKDLKRKRMAAKANGGWRPPGPPPGSAGAPGSMGPPPTGGQMPRGPPQMPQMPSFSGMVPVSGDVKVPMGFEEYDSASPKSTSSGEYDLDSQRTEAEEEWHEIRNMFSVLEDHFGDDFQAMGPEISTPVQTPFGTALQYRTYGIAGICMNYYMGLIACHRAHPAMPPSAMMAAGFAARQTASMANHIGRIAAGLAPDCSMTASVNPSVGAGLIESATCLFISGVQYQDPAQRAWTVNRLRDIARLTGWQTAIAIATGCETSWVKTGEAGHGPPYTRTTEERVVPDIWANGRRIDRATRDRDEDNKLVLRRTDRAYYALGVLGLDDDFEKLDLDKDENPNEE